MSLLDSTYDIAPESLMLGGNFIFRKKYEVAFSNDMIINLDMEGYFLDQSKWKDMPQFYPFAMDLSDSPTIRAIQKACRYIPMSDYEGMDPSQGSDLVQFGSEFTAWYNHPWVKFVFHIRKLYLKGGEISVCAIYRGKQQWLCRMEFMDPETFYDVNSKEDVLHKAAAITSLPAGIF